MASFLCPGVLPHAVLQRVIPGTVHVSVHRVTARPTPVSLLPTHLLSSTAESTGLGGVRLVVQLRRQPLYQFRFPLQRSLEGCMSPSEEVSSGASAYPAFSLAGVAVDHDRGSFYHLRHLKDGTVYVLIVARQVLHHLVHAFAGAVPRFFVYPQPSQGQPTSIVGREVRRIVPRGVVVQQTGQPVESALVASKQGMHVGVGAERTAVILVGE